MNILTVFLTLLSIIATPTNELTMETLETRTQDTLIIEYTQGIVLNDDCDGMILNTDDDYYNYISYSCIKEAVNPGDIIETYFIYNPYTTYTDDIIQRIDVLADGNIYIN